MNICFFAVPGWEEKFPDRKKYYEKRFPEILAYIIAAYKELFVNKESLENNETFITEILVETYLNRGRNREKLGIKDVIFNREPAGCVMNPMPAKAKN